MGIRRSRTRRPWILHTELLHKPAWQPSGVCLTHLHLTGLWNSYTNTDTDNADPHTYCNPNTDAPAYSYTEAAPDSASSADSLGHLKIT